MSDQAIKFVLITAPDAVKGLGEALGITQTDFSATVAAIFQTSTGYNVAVQNDGRLSNLVYSIRGDKEMVLEEVFTAAKELVTTYVPSDPNNSQAVIQTRQDFIDGKKQGEAELLPLTKDAKKYAWQRVSGATGVAKNLVQQTLTP